MTSDARDWNMQSQDDIRAEFEAKGKAVADPTPPASPAPGPVGAGEPFALATGPVRKGNATISPCGLYRYTLTRGLSHGHGIVNFVMLNPSTADAERDDPTIRRCINFGRAWGYYDLVVTNLFAWRATDPKGLRKAADPVGPNNDRIIGEVARSALLVVCAWGSMGSLVSLRRGVAPPWDGLARARRVVAIIREAGARPFALKTLGGNHPAHPLYLPADSEPFEWSPNP